MKPRPVVVGVVTAPVGFPTGAVAVWGAAGGLWVWVCRGRLCRGRLCRGRLWGWSAVRGRLRVWLG